MKKKAKKSRFKRSKNPTSWGKNIMGGRWSVRAPFKDSHAGFLGFLNSERW